SSRRTRRSGVKKKISVTQADDPSINSGITSASASAPASAAAPDSHRGASASTPTPPPIPTPRSAVSLKTPRLSELVGATKPARNGGAAVAQTVEPQSAGPADKQLTDENVQEAWNAFAETRRRNMAEYQLLTQPIDRRDHEIIVHLHNPVQETILSTLRSDLVAFLRARLQNRTVNVVGELKEIETGKLLYTNKEKFDHLVEKYPILKELKDRLGLDPDF